METKHNTRYNPAISFLAFLFFGAALFLTGCRDANYQKMEGVWETKLSDNRLAVIVINNEQFSLMNTDTGVDSGMLNKPFKFILDSGKSPKQFEAPDFGADKKGLHGIFDLSENQLKIAFTGKDEPFPTTFGDKNTLIFERKGASENLVPRDSSYLNGVKTWNYWVRVTKVLESNKSLFPELKPEAGVDEGIKAFEKMTESLRKIRNEIGAVHVEGVDSELTSYISKCNNSLGKLESLVGELLRTIKDLKALQARINSGESLGTRFADWLTDNEDGEYKRLKDEETRIKSNVMAIQKKFEAAEGEFHSIESEQINVRSSLSKKYSREFPQM